MKKQNGFTLLEMLVVLSAWSILLLLCVPIAFTLLEEQREKQILETLKSDVLYLQNLSISSPEKDLVIEFNENGYSIRELTERIITRELPPDHRIDPRKSKLIAFNQRGSIKKGGKIELITKNSAYNIVFPLGKAGCYIAEQ